MRQHIASFNGGEVTPLVEGRTDLPSLQRACRKLRNVIPTSSGAAVRRPSLLHKATPNAAKAKLIPFVADAANRYVIAFRYDRVEVFRSDGTLASTLNIDFPTEYGWPDVDFDIDGVTFAQVNDILFIAHSAMPPLAIKRLGDSSWTFSRYSAAPSGFGRNFWPAFLDDAVTLFDTSDVVEGWTIAKAAAVTTTYIFGGIHDAAITGVENGPFPGFWRLYTGTTAFTGTISIQGADTWNGTYRALYTVTNASTGAMTLRQEWFHQYAYLKIVVTRSSGTATFELRHVGSVSAPSVWYGYPNSTGPFSPSLLSVYSSPTITDFVDGECIQLTGYRSIQQVGVTVAASTADEFKTSAELYVLGKWELFTTGSWYGDVYVEAKESTGSWRTVRHLTSNKDQNWSISGTSSGERMRVRVVKYDAAATTSAAVPRFTLAALDSAVQQWLKIGDASAISNPTLMDGFDVALAAQATTAVARAAFSSSQGFPSAVCIHDQRVYFAGSAKRPTTVWASSVNDLFNFRRTTLDDSGFMFEIASNEGNPIQWMLSASRGILVGTAGDEWLLDGADTGITPSNITARRQSRIGSGPIQAIPAAGSTIFVQRGSMHVQEYQFAWESQQFQAVDLTELCKHLTPSGIRCISFSQNPEPMLWAVMLDGSLLTCTYNRAQEVIAWAKHTTSGTFESVCCTYGETANSDDVWFVVLRDGTRRLEKVDGSFWASLYNDGKLYHADAAVVKSEVSPFTSVTGLSHLNGLTVKILADGVAQADVVVSGGTVAVPSGTTHAVVGLGFDSEIQPMPFELPLATGTVQGRKVQTPALAARLYRTKAAKYSDSYTSTFYDMKLSGETSGLVRLANVGRMNDSCEVAFKSSGALPLNLVAVVPQVQVYGE